MQGLKEFLLDKVYFPCRLAIIQSLALAVTATPSTKSHRFEFQIHIIIEGKVQEPVAEVECVPKQFVYK
jgi:hypothetical protein